MSTDHPKLGRLVAPISGSPLRSWREPQLPPTFPSLLEEDMISLIRKRNHKRYVLGRVTFPQACTSCLRTVPRVQWLLLSVGHRTVHPYGSPCVQRSLQALIGQLLAAEPFCHYPDSETRPLGPKPNSHKQSKVNQGVLLPGASNSALSSW